MGVIKAIFFLFCIQFVEYTSVFKDLCMHILLLK